MRKLLVVLTVLLVLGGLVVYHFASAGVTITLRQDQIQPKVESKFPVQRDIGPGARLTLENPQVQLKEGSDRISIAMNAKLEHGPLSVPGSVTVSGSLSYDPAQKAFFLRDASLDAISPAPLEKVRPILSSVLSEKLESTPLQGVDDDAVANKLVNAALVSVTVKDGAVRATFGAKSSSR